MKELEKWMRDLTGSPPEPSLHFVKGGLFLEESAGVRSSSFVSVHYTTSSSCCSLRLRRPARVGFLSVTLDQGGLDESEHNHLLSEVKQGGAFNTTKHLWAGAVAAMVSRYLSIYQPISMVTF